MTQMHSWAYPGVTALGRPVRGCGNLPHAQVCSWPGAGARPRIIDASRAQGISGVIPSPTSGLCTRDNIVTSAGVSAGLGISPSGWPDSWAGGPGQGDSAGDEYDPRPPFDSGHMSKASPTTKAAATALLSKDSAKPANLTAATLLAWERALAAVQSRRRKRQPVGAQARRP